MIQKPGRAGIFRGVSRSLKIASQTSRNLTRAVDTTKTKFWGLSGQINLDQVRVGINVNSLTWPLHRIRIDSNNYKLGKSYCYKRSGMNGDREDDVPRHAWRWLVCVSIVLLLGLVFIVLGFVLIIDPNWAYPNVQPIAGLQPIK